MAAKRITPHLEWYQTKQLRFRTDLQAALDTTETVTETSSISTMKCPPLNVLVKTYDGIGIWLNNPNHDYIVIQLLTPF